MTASDKPEPWEKKLTRRIGDNIRAARGQLSAQWIADRTAELGHPIGRATISEIENGRRKGVTVADLLMLAYALDTSPVMLLYGQDLADGPIEALPGVTITGGRALQWHTGSGAPDVALNPTIYKGRNVPVNTFRAYEETRGVLESEPVAKMVAEGNGQYAETLVQRMQEFRKFMREQGMVVADGDDK